ncbi:hypothetical protein Moror_8671 [Moniliophthora roreri MCA 2997]|uniref:Uncharacterized protein n=2 Tax=Moniliophthora roreri TaxID=221103 RepID=V2XAT3_MONRO|nr:hypothetical protein Moror_8671 [Moniliophthora roreri MCA 2997]KAI3611413.1 hypothetical protein WG66_002191 [Moniliophthora roreri]
MRLQKASQLRIPLARSTRRHHPYPRPVYPDPDEEHTPYQPRIEDDSLLYLIWDANHRPIYHARIVENGNENEGEDVEEGNNGLIVGGILLLDFLIAMLFFTKHVLFMGFWFRRDQGDDGQ